LAADRLREYLLQRDWHAVANVSADGSVRATGYGSSVNLDNLIGDWLDASEPLDRPRARRLQWTREEMSVLATKIIAWWDASKRLLGRQLGPVEQMSHDEAVSTIPGVLAVLAKVVIPRIALSDATSVTAISRVIGEMEQSGLNVLSIRKEMVRLGAEEAAKIATAVRSGLDASTEEAVLDAADAIYSWMLGGRSGRLPTPPDYLFTELTNRVASRRQPGLSAVLRATTAVAEAMPDVLREEHFALLCRGLAYLLPETELPDEKGRLWLSDPSEVEFGFELIRSRVLSGRLARVLYDQRDRLQGESAASCEQTLGNWRVALEQATLPEVRNAWIDRSRASVVADDV
jgi:hypothetical protein